MIVAVVNSSVSCEMQTQTVLILLVTVQLARPENVGWKGYLKENTEEFHDLPLTWEEDIASIPSWLSGTYIRNGPAQVEYTPSVFSFVRKSLEVMVVLD